MSLTSEERIRLEIKAGEVFKPATPINEAKLFAGRINEIRKILDAIESQGQHIIIYGERGVGKTSLVNVISELLSQNIKIVSAKTNCDSDDNFNSVWGKIFGQLKLKIESQKPGFQSETQINFVPLAQILNKKNIGTDDVKNGLSIFGRTPLPLIIIDEFDRLPNGKNTRLFADVIKTLSDFSSSATLIIVGVADKVDELIAEHQSCERALVQIQMPRMSKEELNEIVSKGLSQIDMTIDEEVKNNLTSLSQGLPHYTHLLALHSCRKAIDHQRKNIERIDFDGAIKEALENSQQSVIGAYHKATASPRRENLYREVLLACALAKPDDLGYFQAADVREPMRKIMGKRYEISAFSRHLNDFCNESKGSILVKFGTKRKFRFRFKNPLMQPYVIMQGLAEGKIENSILK